MLLLIFLLASSQLELAGKLKLLDRLLRVYDIQEFLDVVAVSSEDFFSGFTLFFGIACSIKPCIDKLCQNSQ